MRMHPAHHGFHASLFNSVLHDPVTAAALVAGSAAVSAAGTIASGNAARGAANFQAAQMNQQAGQERATAQRQALIERQKATLANSRVQALSAAGGGGATDPGVLDIVGDIAGKGEYNALSALFTGEERANSLDMGATAKRYEGQQARSAGVIGAISKVAMAAGTIAGGGSTLFDKYAGPYNPITNPNTLSLF